MPLRKQHVRRTVAALMVVLVPGVLAAVAWYGWRVRSGGYGRDLGALLEARLRCHATVSGARPTGIGTASAESVSLVWHTGGGRLTLDLAGLSSERKPDGRWRVSAETASVGLEGRDPPAALVAVNQRLIQTDADLPLAHLAADRVFIRLETGLVALSLEGRSEALFEKPGHVFTRFWLKGAPGEDPPEKPHATLALDPTSPDGAWAGLVARAEDVPARCLWRPTATPGRSEQVESGTIDVDVTWRWFGLAEPKAVLAVIARGLALEEWTAGLPGGPVTGTADAEVHYTEVGHRPGRWQVHVTGGGGRIAAETLRRFERALEPLDGVGGILRQRIGYDRLDARLALEGGEAWFEPAGGAEEAALVTTGLFGTDVPLLWASGAKVRSSDLRALAREALGLEPGPP